MKKIMLLSLIILYLALNKGFAQKIESPYTGHIYLYGEEHGVKKIIETELKIWQEYYKKGLRHLFLELPYYTAQFLNIWLTEKDDTILEEIYNDWNGTAFHNEYYFNFFIQIKKYFPQTVFHGNDVGHQYKTTGYRFLKYLEAKNLHSSPQYSRTKKIIEQGKKYYNENNPHNMIYRENMLTENFIYELKKLGNASLMGIYGAAHTNVESLDLTGTVSCMAKALKAIYSSNITSKDLSCIAKEIEHIRTDVITIKDKQYTAYYYGKQELNGFKGFLYREFWHLENAYNIMKQKTKTGDWLPYNNYPMKIEKGEVYVIDYTKIDKTKIRLYYISDGTLRQGQYVTENITIE